MTPFVSPISFVDFATYAPGPGVELVADRDTKTPLDDDACGAIVRRCADAGVVVGRNASTVPGLGNVLILAPPFVIEEHECARVAETLRAALDA